MIRKITVVLSLLLLSATLLTAKGQGPSDSFKDGASLEIPGIHAKVETDKGMLIFRLDYINTPLTVLNFINIAEQDFYNGLEFYRDIENYALFSGDPANDGSSDAGYNYPMETGGDLKHDGPGVLSMDAVSGMSSSSRFFISRTADPVLDGKYTAFGELLEGHSVLAKLKRGSEILSIEIIRTGDEAKAFDTGNSEYDRLSKVAMDRQLETFKEDNPEVVAAIDVLGEGVQKTLTGIFYKISQEGNGQKAVPGDTVSVHYTAMLVDGTVFDSSVARGAPIEFPVGTQSVITGWDESILSMSVGEKRTVIIPPNLAYGNVQAGPIPPNSWLMFQIEFIEIK